MQYSSHHFLEKIMEIYFITTSYSAQIYFIITSYMKYGWIWWRILDTDFIIYHYLTSYTWCSILALGFFKLLHSMCQSSLMRIQSFKYVRSGSSFVQTFILWLFCLLWLWLIMKLFQFNTQVIPLWNDYNKIK